MTRRRCPFCERETSINGLTGGLRYHLFPRNVEPPSVWIVQGEPCPGTGSGAR